MSNEHGIAHKNLLPPSPTLYAKLGAINKVVVDYTNECTVRL